MTTKVNCPKCHERFLLVDGGVVSNPSSIAGDTEVSCVSCGVMTRLADTGIACSRCLRAMDHINIRDRFAMVALQGILAHPGCSLTFQGFADEVYKFADAMLKAREEGKR